MMYVYLRYLFFFYEKKRGEIESSDILGENLRGRRRWHPSFNDFHPTNGLTGIHIHLFRRKAHSGFHPRLLPFPNDSSTEDGRREVIARPRPAKRIFLPTRRTENTSRTTSFAPAGKSISPPPLFTFRSLSLFLSFPGNHEHASEPIHVAYDVGKLPIVVRGND